MKKAVKQDISEVISIQSIAMILAFTASFISSDGAVIVQNTFSRSQHLLRTKMPRLDD
jgi:oligoribonuclease (3'-5' exoribonuclease)